MTEIAGQRQAYTDSLHPVSQAMAVLVFFWPSFAEQLLVDLPEITKL